MRFTIRDLLWLTLLAAVLVAWWIDRRAQARRIDELMEASQRALYFLGDSDLSNPAGSR
ncbi:MAG TPA: hypothetical protein VFB96_02240 [Pirellulaceae bacterium]|nr:hypothetical protein [Pirellulaceae bacterium]